MHGHLLWQGYQSFFAVIFWYALLGPVAALAYRLLALALEHARQPALREQAARVRHILDWLPVRALVLSFALVGNFLAVIRVLLHWLLAWDISAAALLGKAGRVASDVEAVELRRRRRQPGCALAIAGARGRALVCRVRLLRAVPLSVATGNPPAIPR